VAPLAIPHASDPYDRSYPYEEVHVMTVSFVDDDMKVEEELKDAADLFRTDFGFSVSQKCRIPSQQPTNHLKRALKSFTGNYGNKRDGLLILVIACHGILREGELILGR
jgi:hypothetical protein